MTYLQAYFRSWQTLLPRAWYSYWCVDLACELTKSPTPRCRLVGGYMKDAVHWQVLQVRELLQRVMECAERIGENDEVNKKAANSL
jgi:hypothetical protein